MNILVTNDDGIYSPGLAAAAEAAMQFGDIFVAAPSNQKTGSGRSLIGHRDQHLQKTEIEVNGKKYPGYHMDCTPALVVKHAFNTILRDTKIDIAVSGINYGENIGYDITISGTVGAAIECAVRGIPSFAVSLQTHIENHLHYGDVDWDAPKYFLATFVKRCVEQKGFSGFDICKLDIPETATRLSKQSYFATFVENSKDDTKLSEVTLGREKGTYEDGTDAGTINTDKKVSVTPLSLDWTASETGDFFSFPY
jgi:5'-nucleotidase